MHLVFSEVFLYADIVARLRIIFLIWLDHEDYPLQGVLLRQVLD